MGRASLHPSCTHKAADSSPGSAPAPHTHPQALAQATQPRAFGEGAPPGTKDQMAATEQPRAAGPGRWRKTEAQVVLSLEVGLEGAPGWLSGLGLCMDVGPDLGSRGVCSPHPAHAPSLQ